jgi:hypothetical protein
MAYRTELAHLTEELSAKTEALADTRARLERATDDEQALSREVEALGAKVERARRRLDVLGSVEIASPCEEPWDRMQGDDRVRFCGRCEKHVYNLSGMSAIEAERIVTETTGELCVRFHQRADGTVLTQDCPVGVRRQRLRTVRNVVIGSVAMAGLGAVGLTGIAMTRMGAMARPRRPVADAMRMVERETSVAADRGHGKTPQAADPARSAGAASSAPPDVRPPKLPAATGARPGGRASTDEQR